MATVDTPVAGARLRDVKNGFSIPPALTRRTILDALPRPAWWINFLTTEPLAFASLDRWSGTVAALVDTMFDPTVGPEEVRYIRDHWKGKLLVKGIQSVADARLAVDLGADGLFCRTTAAASSTEPRSRSTCYRASCVRSAPRPRFTSTPAS